MRPRRDPLGVLDLACPSCHAKPGQLCTVVGGERTRAPHKARETLRDKTNADRARDDAKLAAWERSILTPREGAGTLAS